MNGAIRLEFSTLVASGFAGGAVIVKNPSGRPSGSSRRFLIGHIGSTVGGATRGTHIGYELDARTVGLSSSIVNRSSGDLPAPKPLLNRAIGSLIFTRVMPSMVISPVV